VNESDLEKTYEALAQKIDQVGAAQSELFLARLVLLLAHNNGDYEQVRQLIDDAAVSIDHQRIKAMD
jgi:hypothetical protein